MPHILQLAINNNKAISLFDTGTTISCMSKACFDKLDPKPTLTHTHSLKLGYFELAYFKILPILRKSFAFIYL